ncbi:MAG: hypothetical protein U0869_20280 [Chloroflexota bacterium]
MHPLDALAGLDLARRHSEVDRNVREGTHRRAARLRTGIATRLRGGPGRPPRHP